MSSASGGGSNLSAAGKSQAGLSFAAMLYLVSSPSLERDVIQRKMPGKNSETTTRYRPNTRVCKALRAMVCGGGLGAKPGDEVPAPVRSAASELR